MPERDPENWRSLAHVLPWISTLVISSLATIAQYAAKLRGGESFSWRNLSLDATICIFVAILTHMLCEWQQMDGMLRSILVGISAHMGTRAMLLYERWRDRVFGFDEGRS